VNADEIKRTQACKKLNARQEAGWTWGEFRLGQNLWSWSQGAEIQVWQVDSRLV
jgi:hypothetical protein